MKKRSRYKPKGVILDTMGWVKQGMKRVEQLDSIGIDLKIKNHAALASLVQGRGTRDDIDLVINALNMTEALAIVNAELGSDWREEIRLAQDALLAMIQRGVQLGDRFIFRGDEMKAVNLGMEIHDAQLERSTVRDIELALDRVNQEIKNKRARLIQ